MACSYVLDGFLSIHSVRVRWWPLGKMDQCAWWVADSRGGFLLAEQSVPWRSKRARLAFGHEMAILGFEEAFERLPRCTFCIQSFGCFRRNLGAVLKVVTSDSFATSVKCASVPLAVDIASSVSGTSWSMETKRHSQIHPLPPYHPPFFHYGFRSQII